MLRDKGEGGILSGYKKIINIHMNEETLKPAGEVVPSAPSLDSIVSLFKQAWGLYTGRFLKLLGVVLVPVLLGTAVLGGVSYLWENSTSPAVLWAAIIFAFITMLVAAPLSQLALVSMVAVPNEETNILSVLKASLRKILPYLWVAILSSLAIFSGFVLFVIPGIFLGVTLMFTSFFLVHENMRGREALVKSYEHVMGHWWPVFGRVFVLFVLMTGVSSIIDSVLKAFGPVASSLVGNVVTMPFIVAFLYLLYKNLKAIKADPAPEVVQKRKKMFSILSSIGLVLFLLLLGGMVYLLKNLPLAVQ